LDFGDLCSITNYALIVLAHGHKLIVCVFDVASMELGLQQRIEYLSRAAVCAKSSTSHVLAAGDGEFLHELEDKMEVSKACCLFLHDLRVSYQPWLRIPERIQFRLYVLAYRCVHGTAPAYLADSLQLTADVRARRRLRSTDTMMLQAPPTRRSTLGDRAFPVAAARAWNGLPPATRATNSLLQFRRETKAYLFRSSYYD